MDWTVQSILMHEAVRNCKTMQKPPKKVRPQPKHAAIIEAAAELFVQHGYDGTSTEMIAARAGVSRQTIYNQFESKEALFLAIASHLVEEVLAPLAGAVQGSEKLRDTLLTFGRRMLATLVSRRTIALYRLVVSEVIRFPELGRAVYDAGPVTVEKELALYLSGRSELRVPDPKLAACHFLALIAHPIEFKVQLGIEVDAAGPEFEQHVEAAVDTFLRAFSRNSTENGKA